jgi:hypothetical protein
VHARHTSPFRFAAPPRRAAQALAAYGCLAAVLLTGCSARASDTVVSAPAPLAELEVGAGVTLRRELAAAIWTFEASLLAGGLEWTIYMDMAPTAGAEEPPEPPRVRRMPCYARVDGIDALHGVAEGAASLKSSLGWLRRRGAMQGRLAAKVLGAHVDDVGALEGEDGEEGDEAAPAPAKRRTGVGRAAAKTARHGLAAAKEDAKQAAATDEDKHRADVVLIDHEISPSQARNLEDALGCEVMDRTMVILEIFHRNARTPAAQAQVEIARLGYMAPRLREDSRVSFASNFPELVD